MTPYLVDVAAFALRWLHVIAAIAWIGESFYFVMLDRSLKPGANEPETNEVGESWSVHGGGFYHKRKFMPAPARLPAELHWSKWKSYTTWLSGFALLSVLYLASPRLYLIDPAVAALTPTQAVMFALAFLAASWLVYDGLCRAIGFRDGWLGAAVAAQVLAMCYVATHTFAGGAAFLLVGAGLATIMSANVFFVIIPGQKRMVAALARGEAPDPLAGLRGKQRSVHNTYFTLPVVFAMLGNHFAIAHAGEHAWLVLAVFMAGGALIRQYFVLWHSGQRAWWLLAVGGFALCAAFYWLAPRPTPATAPVATPASTVATDSADAPGSSVAAPTPATTAANLPAHADVSTAGIVDILARRCGACHSAQPSLMASAPKGALFDTPEQIELRAALIYTQTVRTRAMPPGNITQISDEERAAIARWYEARSEQAGD
ncbi:urate hydroxylase PuuD [Arenimonas sp.]|uniref:urate hydroxylase PuuD n=1 Tax=Arenimonas sp. TaxID=1872635 RepID=UPI0039E41CE7